MATAVVLVRKSVVAVRKFHCAACGRYLTETTAREGTIRVKCEYCRKWRIVDVVRNVVE